MRIVVVVAGLCGLVGAGGLGGPAGAEPAPFRLSQQLLRMTPEQFEHSASIKDDDLEMVTTITTQPGHPAKRGLLGVVGSDNFLRAFVSKTTGAATYQLYQMILDRHYKQNSYDQINYETPHGTKTATLIKLVRDEDCSMRRLWGVCAYYESVAVPIDEALLTEIAARYQPGQDAVWKFRFKAESGLDHDDAMTAAEVAGLLAAVVDYRHAHHLPGA
jgi:hypothetical protein